MSRILIRINVQRLHICGRFKNESWICAQIMADLSDFSAQKIKTELKR